MIRYMLAAFLAGCLATSAMGQTIKPWTWTAPAKHHNAVVYVQDSQGFAGTGTLVQANKDYTYGIILTAAHVIGNNHDVTAKWQDDKLAKCKVLYCNHNSDVAIMAVDPPTGATFIPMSAKQPPIGATVECVGLGSPVSSLRHYSGKVTGTNGDIMEIDTPVTHGDSGGPIIYQGRVVGAITGGTNLLCQSRENWNVYTSMIASNARALRVAVEDCQCPGGICPEPPSDIEWINLPQDPGTLPMPPAAQKPDPPSVDPIPYPVPGGPSIQPVPDPRLDELLDYLRGGKIQPVPNPITLPVEPPNDAYLIALLQYMHGSIVDLQVRVRKLEARQVQLTDEQKQLIILEIYRQLQVVTPQQRDCIIGMLFSRTPRARYYRRYPQ